MKQAPGEFTKKVIALALSIPPGRVVTYGQLAVAAGGHPMLAQMITHILGKSSVADKIPWHRIVYASGKIWSDPKFDKIRKKLYNAEGIKLDKNNKIIDFEKLIYLPKLDN
jgi:methylated-DNA-protein-cysteine methyltransferase-like protein